MNRPIVPCKDCVHFVPVPAHEESFCAAYMDPAEPTDVVPKCLAAKPAKGETP